MIRLVAVLLAALAGLSGCGIRMPGSAPKVRSFTIEYRVHNSLDVAMLVHWDDGGHGGQEATVAAGTRDWKTTLTVDSKDPSGPMVGAVLVAAPAATSSSKITCDLYVDGVHAAANSGQSACTARYDLSRLTGKPTPVGT